MKLKDAKEFSRRDFAGPSIKFKIAIHHTGEKVCNPLEFRWCLLEIVGHVYRIRF